MPTLTRSVALRQAGVFVAATYASVLALALALPDNPLVTVLMMGTPTLGVALTIATTAARGERRRTWGTIGFRVADWRGFAVAVAVPAVVVTVSLGIAAAAGVARYPGLASIDPVSLLLELLVTGTLLALGEEIGWRGYLLPRLVAVTGRTTNGALLTGAAHAAFHLPALLLTSVYQGAGSRLVVVPTVMVTLTLAGVLYAWLRRTSGSIWPVALAHNAFNTFWTYGALAAVVSSPATFAYVTTETGLVTMLLAAVVAALIIRRTEESQP